MDDKKEESAEGMFVGLDYQYPSTVIPAANHMVVQKDVHEFHLSFFQVQPPVILGGPEEKKKILTELGSVPAICVARVTIAEGRMLPLIRMLIENYERNIGPLPPLESTGGDSNKKARESDV